MKGLRCLINFRIYKKYIFLYSNVLNLFLTGTQINSITTNQAALNFLAFGFFLFFVRAFPVVLNEFPERSQLFAHH